MIDIVVEWQIQNPAFDTIFWVCDHQRHGYCDNYLTFDQLKKKSKTKTLHLTCQPVCTFTRQLLELRGTKSREVSLITLEPHNGLDDGHRMLEVLYEGKWIIVDITARNLFRWGDIMLNAQDLIDLPWHQIEIIKFSNAPILAYGDLIYNGRDLTEYMENIFLNEENHRAWYKRICQSVTYH